jgi:hypothetical protein
VASCIAALLEDESDPALPPFYYDLGAINKLAGAKESDYASTKIKYSMPSALSSALMAMCPTRAEGRVLGPLCVRARVL